MSTGTDRQQEQIERVLGESDRPADAAREEPLEPELHPDRTRNLTSTNFSRMRTQWVGADAMHLEVVQSLADQAVRERFRVAYNIIEQLYLNIREPQLDPDTRQPMRAFSGDLMWVTDEFGNPVEMWERLSPDLRTRFLFAITIHLFEWEQAAANIWAEAMYSKVQWEEKFAHGFLALPGSQISGKPTVDDRTQTGHRYSADDRYFAIFRSVLSRKSDALVRSMTRLQKLLENTADR